MSACHLSMYSQLSSTLSCHSWCFVTHMFSERTIIDVEDSFPSWVFDHLGVYHVMDPNVREDLVPPPMEEIVEPRDDPQLVEDVRSPPEKETNAKPHFSIFEDYPCNVKGWKMKFFFVSGDDWEVAHGESREFVVLSSLVKRSDVIVQKLDLGEFYSVKNLLRSKVFFKYFPLAQQMEYSGRDNEGREVNACDVAQVRANEVMFKKVDLKKLVSRAQAKAIVKRARPTQDAALETSLSKRKTPLVKATKSAKSTIPLDSITSRTMSAHPDGGDKTTSVHLGVFLGLEALVIKNPTTSKKLASKMELDKVDLDLAEEGDEVAEVDRDETAVQDQVSPIEGGKKGITLLGQF
ncbi:Myosin-6 like [Actinidia chinensis var. chinensis]|uniref:Myosin-6 like n=1 Tax=Actinidia chinensis var. chinensis TaxID=1590841 RepID=A0A2R6QHM8_ACTCC|nr:Myosin-6 like [Actinidia chinensis var. chinensis]